MTISNRRCATSAANRATTQRFQTCPVLRPADARGALREKQSQQNADGSRRAIGRNENCADVEEDWMHLSKNTASALSGVARE